MINRKPKSFSLVYGSGVSGEACDPLTGRPWHRLKFSAIKHGMADLAKASDDTLALINNCSGDFITVTPEGKWS